MNARRLFLAIWGLGLFGMGVRETLDPDMWWHLRTGEAILRDGWPQHDIFSFTVPHHAWVTHEWLSQVIMWLVYRAAGLPGLMVWAAVLVVATFAALLAAALTVSRHRGTSQPKQLYLPAFFVLWGAIASAIVWGARPQMFNLLFGAIFVLLLERIRAGRGGVGQGWWLVGLTAVWANLHSGYLFGVVLLATFTLSEAAQRWWQPNNGALMRWQTLRMLGLTTVGCLLAAALNPSGTAIWFYPFATLGSAAMQSYIQEWQPPTLQAVADWPFFVLLMVVLLLLQRNGRKRKQTAEGFKTSAVSVYPAPFWSDGVLVLGTAVASLGSARHIPLFVLVAVPVLARLVDWRLEIKEGQPALAVRRWVNVGLVGVVLLMVGLWTAVKVAGNEAAIAERYPVAAVDFLQAQGLVRGYNSYNWGGYLIWRGLPVFVDGRADVYGDPFLQLYRQTFEGQVGWERPLDDYAVQYVLIERDAVLAQLLTTSPRWTEAYQDELAQIFTRTP
ncbi:MAG: hypothetical protein H6668_04595 [Ardenticatenaceae bacterium]|nr:hypothetical protein [Ardenticatenaceae bacterium]